MWCIRFVLCVAAIIGRLNFASQPEPFGLLLSAFMGVPLFIMPPLLPFIIEPLVPFSFVHVAVPLVVVAVVVVVEFGMLLLPGGGIMLLQFVAGAVLGHCTVVAVVGLATVGVWVVVVP